MSFPIGQAAKKKWVPHIIKDGARFHVIAYGRGWPNSMRCSEPNCEINKPIDRVIEGKDHG